MLSRNFDILTPMSKVHRISRTIWKRQTFGAEPGMWVALVKDVASGYVPGSVTKVDDTNASNVFALCINYCIPADQPISTYEANDTKIGRISTIEEPGIRCQMSTGLFVTGSTLHIGTKLYVSKAINSVGMLTNLCAIGDIAVARVESISGSDIEIKTIDQVAATVAVV